MAKRKYNTEFFIDRFKAIPREKWTCGDFKNHDGPRMMACALGHCGANDDNTDDADNPGTPMASALTQLFTSTLKVYPHQVNDFEDGHNIPVRERNGQFYVNRGKHPRTRILNALRDIKKLEAKA